MHNKQWFIDRIGKRIYREHSTCPCESCKDGNINGIVIIDDFHSGYLYMCQEMYNYRDIIIKTELNE